MDNGLGFEALSYHACTKLLGPVSERKRANGAKGPGHLVSARPGEAAINIGHETRSISTMLGGCDGSPLGQNWGEYLRERLPARAPRCGKKKNLRMRDV